MELCLRTERTKFQVLKRKPPLRKVGGNLNNWYQNFSDGRRKMWTVQYFDITNTQKVNPENKIVRIHLQCI